MVLILILKQTNYGLTEIGPKYGDEINLAEPGFNSGSDKIFGIWKVNDEGKKLKTADDKRERKKNKERKKR